MRTAAWETAPQTALKNCFKEVEEGQYISDSSEGRIHAIKHIFFQKVSASLMKLSASHEKQLSL